VKDATLAPAPGERDISGRDESISLVEPLETRVGVRRDLPRRWLAWYPGAQECVQGRMRKGCELHRRSPHPSGLCPTIFRVFVRRGRVQQAPKAGALPDCATPRTDTTAPRLGAVHHDDQHSGLVRLLVATGEPLLRCPATCRCSTRSPVERRRICRGPASFQSIASCPACQYRLLHQQLPAATVG
jgi:hypothetical protein